MSSFFGSPRFRGAHVTRSTSQSIPNSTSTAVAWDSEVSDTDAIHDTATNNSRLTVPSGVTVVRLIGATDWFSAAGSYRICQIKQNSGGAIVANDYRAPIFESYATLTSGPVAVIAGDYFELFVQQDSGGALNFNANARAWFKMEIVQ
jgi:hypothetical protein